MSNIPSRGKANLEVVVGAVTQAVGKFLGDEKMEAEGAAHQVIGHARDDAAKAAEHTRGVVEEVLGIAKGKAGHLVDDPNLVVEGKVEELTGKARQALNP